MAQGLPFVCPTKKADKHTMNNKKQGSGQPLVSVVIPNYNGDKYIINCLVSVFAQEYSNLEIIVVDDCSIDKSPSLLEEFNNIRLILNERNSGFAYSVNRGIEAAQGEYILLLNNDVVLNHDFVEKITQAAENSQRIFSVSSKMIRFKERDLLDDTGDFMNLFGWGWKRGDGMPVRFFRKPDRVFSACAGAGLYRSSVFDEIGIFDENHFAYLEDIDIGWRALIEGYENWYEPQAVCYHIGSATTAGGEKYSPFKVKISARNNIYLIYKNMPPVQIAVNLPFLAAGFGIKYLRFAAGGYGKEYREGFAEGCRNLKKLKKVPVKSKNIGSYLKIEAKLAVNVFRYASEKVFSRLV